MDEDPEPEERLRLIAEQMSGGGMAVQLLELLRQSAQLMSAENKEARKERLRSLTLRQRGFFRLLFVCDRHKDMADATGYSVQNVRLILGQVYIQLGLRKASSERPEESDRYIGAWRQRELGIYFCLDWELERQGAYATQFVK